MAHVFRHFLAEEGSPGRFGIRFKSLEAPTRRRGVQTVALVLDHLSDLCGDGSCLLTLPKVTSVAQVDALVAVLERLEKGLSWTPREPAVRDPGGDAPDHPRAGRLRAGGHG